MAAGLEYYGDLGRISHIGLPKKQEHLIFPVVDIDLGPRWEFNLGVGAGLTPATDRLIIKAILGYRFGPMSARIRLGRLSRLRHGMHPAPVLSASILRSLIGGV